MQGYKLIALTLGMAVMAAFRTVYSDPHTWWDGYEMAEKLIEWTGFM